MRSALGRSRDIMSRLVESWHLVIAEEVQEEV